MVGVDAGVVPGDHGWTLSSGSAGARAVAVDSPSINATYSVRHPAQFVRYPSIGRPVVAWSMTLSLYSSNGCAATIRVPPQFQSSAPPSSATVRIPCPKRRRQSLFHLGIFVYTSSSASSGDDGYSCPPALVAAERPGGCHQSGGAGNCDPIRPISATPVSVTYLMNESNKFEE